MKTILVVDDNSVALNLAKSILSDTYSVVTAISGEECISILSKASCDLILLDIRMPNLNGVETLKKLKENELTAEIPIIFLTGVNDRESVMRIVKHKPDGYLLKTSRKSELLDALERFFVMSIFHYHIA